MITASTKVESMVCRMTVAPSMACAWMFITFPVMVCAWMLQYRFERRFGKMPFAQVNHPKYRAAYDFMLLRSQNGEVPVEVVEWWKNFYEADEAGRHEMIEQAEKEARGAGSKKRTLF